MATSKVGAHLLIWTSRLSEDAIGIFHKIKETGFDGVEIPLVHPMEIEFIKLYWLQGKDLIALGSSVRKMANVMGMFERLLRGQKRELG